VIKCLSGERALKKTAEERSSLIRRFGSGPERKNGWQRRGLGCQPLGTTTTQPLSTKLARIRRILGSDLQSFAESLAL